LLYSEDLNEIAQLFKSYVIDSRRLAGSRTSMVVLTIIGFLVAMAVIFIPRFVLFQLWWVFNTIATCVVVPTVLSLYWDRLNPKGVLLGVLIAFFVELPIFIYSNMINNNVMAVLSSLFIILVTTLFCLLMPKRRM